MIHPFFRSNEVIFTFLPRNEAEARTFVTNIVPFFLHNFHEDLLKEIFQSEAINRAKSLIWNAETREIESADDAYMNNTGDGIDDFDLLDTMGIEEDADVRLQSSDGASGALILWGRIRFHWHIVYQ